MIKLVEKEQDQVNEYMTLQYHKLKKEFVRQLLANLMQSNISFKELEPFFSNATSFLTKDEDGERLAKELKVNLTEVEKMLAA